MYLYQRGLLASPAPSDRGPMARPTSPGLVPVNNPGPVQRSTSMPSLPRFHPARFPSQQSNVAATPVTGSHIPRHSDAQLQIYPHQRELLASPAPSDRRPTEKPTSPRLVPVNSPGPVTPLELENAESYLAARANSTNVAYHNDELVREEAVCRDFHLADADTKEEGSVGSMHITSVRCNGSEPRDCQMSMKDHMERGL